jgi:hypothetical protein
MTITDAEITEIVKKYDSFTATEHEIINNYIAKKQAERETEAIKKYAETDNRYINKSLMVKKNKETAEKHKKELLNNTLEEFNGHKDILLQCIATLQNLVQNPNLMTDLKDLINSDWGGGMTLKEKIFNIIDNHENKLNEIHMEAYNIRNTPLIFFVPEIYAETHESISKLPAYDAPAERETAECLKMTNDKIPYAP